MKARRKAEKGITLVALVITIVVLIILATVTINVAFGEGGLIEKAQQAKNLTEQAVEEEQEALNTLMDEYTNIMAEEPEVPEPEPQPGDPIDGTLAEGPQVSEGMTPVKYIEGTGWVKTTAVDEEWYDYNAKEWANVILGDATFSTSGSYEVLDENATYSMLVWIPRYAYKITSNYHYGSENGGNIEIVFLDTQNKDKDGADYSEKTKYPGVTGEGTASGAMDDYVVHPSFTFGEDELAGYWVGKFESSNNGGKIQIKGGVQSWRSISVNDIHNICVGMNNSGNSYGLSDSDSVVDPHMMKNSEWGAVAYLAQSKYGKNSEVTINNYEDCYTGGGNSATSYLGNKNQSTTGNETGIYDMSGCAFEYVAGYLKDGNTSYGSSLVNSDARYRDVYTSYTVPDTSTKLYGDAVYETSSAADGNTYAWYSNYSEIPFSDVPFFVRSGYYGNGGYAGLFYLYRNYGSEFKNYSFRVVVPIL